MNILSQLCSPMSVRRMWHTRRILNSIADGVVVCDAGSRITFMNRAMDALLKACPGEYVGRSALEFVHPDDREAAAHAFARCLQSPELAAQAHVRIVDGEGTLRNMQGLAANRLADRRIRGIVITMRDLTQAVATELARKEQDEAYRALIEEAVDAIVTATLDGTILSVNGRACALLGYSHDELVGRKTFDFAVDAERAAAHEALHRVSTGEPQFSQRRFRHKDGRSILVDVHSKRLSDGRVHGILRDVRDRIEREQHALQTQRLEAIGLSAAGIAHDFNNVLGIVLLSAEQLRSLATAGSPEAEALADLQWGIETARAMVRRMIRGSHTEDLVIRRLSLCDWIVAFERTARHVLSSRFALTVIAPSDLPPVSADETALDECMLNLLINARDAMPEGGSLTVTIASAVIGNDSTATYVGTAGREYAQITLRDSGPGMDEVTLQRVFEPYFTTKHQTGGTGLGLSMVYRLMQAQQGFVSATSELGAGTAFTLHLPVAA